MTDARHSSKKSKKPETIFQHAFVVMTREKTVDARQLKSMLHDGTEFALLDVREAGEFGESHMLFATPCPYSRIELAIGALAPRISAPIVLTDDGSSGIAERAAKRLQARGCTDVAVVAGGSKSWTEAGYALFAGVNVPSKTFRVGRARLSDATHHRAGTHGYEGSG